MYRLHLGAVVATLTLFSTGTWAADKPDAAALAQNIDRAIDKALEADKIAPSAKADDAEFLRRAYLDITGAIPSPEKVAAFLDSTDPDKRAKLIDELLASPAFGRHMADIWQGLLIQADSNNRRVSFDALHGWLEKSFNENKAWDKLVTDLVTASGPQNDNGAVTFFLANPTADKVTDQVCKLFLGVQLQCAQCHNHPFTSWKRDEYWGMAAFFVKVRSDRANKNNANALSVVEASGPKGKGAKLPDSARIVPAKFLQGEQPKVESSEPVRPVLAKWMTSAENPFFAAAMTNRTWAHFFGRGFVNPIDDMHEGNPASHPELLKAMAKDFSGSGFDLKHLIRGICNSQAYQRTSRPTDANKDDVKLFSHMSLKAMTAEQLYDSLTAVLGGEGNANKGGGKGQAGKRPQGTPRTQFVNFFRTDDTAPATDYTAGIPQALRLMNAPQLNRGGALLDAVKSASPEQTIERLYLGTVSRRPTAEEKTKMVAYVQKHKGEERRAYGDVLWALLNSSEFVLNH
jgi:hypothetical protein